MTNKWSDEFDLLEEPDRKKPKKDDPKKARQSSNDYFDLEQDNKNLKLPVISKNQPVNLDKNTKSTSNINLVQLNKKKVQTGNNKKTEKEEDQDEYQFQESLAPNPSTVKAKSPPKNEGKKAEPPKHVEEESYGEEQFENEEKYEQDFEEHEEKVLSPVGYKPKQPPKKPVNVPKAAQKERKGNSMAKKPEINTKINSRNSIRSQSASRTGNSRAKAEEKKEDPPNKYTNLADKACANYDKPALEELPMDKLVRQNDKIRAMIKKFNDELNDLINRNIMQLKSKKQEKVVPADDIIKNLEEQKNSNETAYQTTVKQLNRLKGKEGQLREEEYQLSLEQKIAEAKASMNECTKVITKLKLDVNNEGNKLTKIDKEVTSTQQINNLKGSYMLIKKQQQKNDEILQKLYIKFQELTRKISEAEGRYNTQLEEAKQKGFSVQINPEMTKKSEEVKKKLDISRQHKSKTQNLYKTKCDMLGHECEQVKNQLRAMDTVIQSTNTNCEQMQNESKKIVQKARRNSKLSQDIVNTLDTIIYELENGPQNQSSREKEDHNSFSYPKGAKKYQSQKSVEKVVAQQVATTREEKERPQDDLSLKKPNLFKKKDKQQEKAEERVWKDDKNNEPKKLERPIASSIPDLAKFENKEEGEKKDEEKKKPFVIKRNKDVKASQEVATEAIKEQPKIEKIQAKKQPQKTEEVPSLAPRMMKFRRNKEQPLKAQQEKAKVPQPKVQEKIVPQENDKPIFAPKRFQLKAKQRNSEEGGYVASVVQKKQQPKPAQQFKPKGLTIEKQPIIIPETKNAPLKIPEQKPIANDEQQQKPKFNLRMRDRQRESNKQQTKIQVPPQPVKEPEAKITITLNDKAKENNNQLNPYAVNTSNDPPRRQREGPLKKQKLATNGQKQNFNIYDQAEDITNVKEIKIGQESPQAYPQKAPTAEEPSLHDLLGLKKVSKAVDDDLILDPKFASGKGGKPQKKKDTNFFGDLQL